jgi:hypothetical protein
VALWLPLGLGGSAVIGIWSYGRGLMLGHLVGGPGPSSSSTVRRYGCASPPQRRSVLELDRLASAGSPTSSRGSECHASDARISISAVVAGGSGGSPYVAA